MNINKAQLSLFLSIVFFVCVTAVQAQTLFQLGSDQELKVSGTSTLHDWDMESDKASGEVRMELNGKEILQISTLNIQLPARSLKNGSSRMERLAYNTLNADDHKDIRFELLEVRNITANTVLASGNLFIAGKTRPVTLRTNYEINGNRVIFKGSHNIKFSDFDIDSPTALFGTIKTGDDIVLSFDVEMIAVN